MYSQSNNTYSSYKETYQCMKNRFLYASALKNYIQYKMSNGTSNEVSGNSNLNSSWHHLPTDSRKEAYPNNRSKRSPAPYSFHPNYNPKLNQSTVSYQPDRQHSPSISNVSSKQFEYFKSIEFSLLNETRNLKEQNNFLVAQVKSLYQRQRKQGEALQRIRKHCKELEFVNHHLQQQLEALTTHTLAEIERIQKLLKNQRFGTEEELMVSSQSSARKSEGLGWETEQTVNHNLEQLKIKMKKSMLNPITICSNFDTEPNSNLLTHSISRGKHRNLINNDSKGSKASIWNNNKLQQYSFYEYLSPAKDGTASFHVNDERKVV